MAGLAGWWGKTGIAPGNGGAIRHSYAIGSVTGNKSVGGLIGYNYPGGSITESYWNIDATANGVGDGSNIGATGQTTGQLQSPTANTGIYADWNALYWDFGDSTRYPALKADMDGDGTATAAEFGEQEQDGTTPTSTPIKPTSVPPTPGPESTPPPGASPIPPSDDFAAVSGGTAHICGLLSDGTVLCWGDGTEGELSPPTGVKFRSIYGGDTYTCGIRFDGMAVVCWGSLSGTFVK